MLAIILAIAGIVSHFATYFRFLRKVRLVAIASYNDKYCMMLLYLFGHKEGQVRHVPKENLCCTSVLNDTRAVGEA